MAYRVTYRVSNSKSCPECPEFSCMHAYESQSSVVPNFYTSRIDVHFNTRYNRQWRH